MSQVEQLITDDLDVWTSAIKKRGSQGRGSSKKIELYGIKKLRELILDLAVRGLLVPQDSRDQKPKALLENIEAHKKKLSEDKKFKYPSGLIEIAGQESDILYPNNWVKAYLGDVCNILDKLRKPISKNNRIEGPYPYYGASGVVDFVADFIFDEPLVLVGEDGAKWGAGDYTAFCVSGKTWVNNHAHVVKPNREIILDQFLVYVLAQQDLQKYITGITVPKLNQARLFSIILPIPSIAEQSRIVAKVDELMALCDQLEQQTEYSLSAHQTLVETLLNALLDVPQSRDDSSSKESAFDQAWQRIAEHFDVLFTTEHSIDQLKQTILQLAVMGKLVPQDPNDEPASLLIDRLSAERDAWLEENKVENSECKTMLKKLEKLDEANPPFQLPSTWSCVHLIQISRLLVDCHNKTAPYVESGIPIIRTTNIRDREFKFDGLKYVNDETYEYWSRRCPPEPKDIMFTREAPMGEAAIIPEGVKWCLGQRTMLIRLMYEYISNDFLLLTLTEPHLLERASEHAVGLTVKHLRVGDVERLNIPIPPLKEQHRIAAKVDELMVLCDSLKARISESQTTQLHLADAMAEQALA